jgi:putative oxidoreductase
MKKTAATWIARLILGGVFGYAAVLKLLDPSAFATDIGHFHILPHPATLALAVYLPWLELVCAVAVIVRWRERAALLMLTLLCGVFVAALASAAIRGLDLDCGCFGHSPQKIAWPWLIARPLILGLFAFILLTFAQAPVPEKKK